MTKIPSSLKRNFYLIISALIMISTLANQPEKSNLNTVTYIYVDADATGANLGNSWTDAFVYLQDALDLTNSNGSTDYEIWVAEGVYYPDEDSNAGHLNNSQAELFTIGYDNVKIYGGFSGGEISRSERDWVSNPTILSGDIDGNDTGTGNINEDWNDIVGNNAYHVLLVKGTNEYITSYTVVDGFTITAGQADASPGNKHGGGLQCNAFSSVPPAGVCSPTLRNLTIQGNRAQLGGGIVLYMNNDGVSNPLMTNISFIGNLATDDGGGFYSWIGNIAGESNPALVNVKFQGNYAMDQGGGMAFVAINGTNSPTLTNVEFYDNTAEGDGGGISVLASTAGTVSPILTNLVFSGNQAANGGGIKTFEVIGSTFGMELKNSIMWGNTATVFPEIYNYSSSPVITSSDIQGCGSSSGGWVAACGSDNGGNIDVDPGFVNQAAGDLRLKMKSPVIDAGNQTLLPPDITDVDEDGNTGETIELDLAMADRVEWGNVDMGAYEIWKINDFPADFDGDDDTDISIFRPSTGYWYASGSVPVWWGAPTDWPVPGDYDGDATTDVAVWRPSNGYWYIKEAGSYDYSIEWWGFTSDIPFPADYDGDGTTDIAVFRPSTGFWYIFGGSTIQWGVDTDVPVPCDYDGDGATDIAVFRPSSGYWLIDGMAPFWWGASTDIPVPGDYDGDGDCDAAIWRPSNGYWYIKHDGAYTYDIEWWGMSTDIPVPADYDGDGDSDFAVLRPSTGFWYVLDPAITEWYYSPGDFVLPIRDSNGDGDPWH